MNILGIIPARGGSKGFPRKNLAPLLGKPLLAYTAEAALAAKSLSRVILSTDDEEIAEVGHSLGLDVPFLRPAELARDDTPTIDVVMHALQVEGNEDIDAVCLLQPTSPLRTALMIDNACDAFIASGADTLISVLPIPHAHHPDWALVASDKGQLQWANGQTQPPPRRQKLIPAFHREGSIYFARSEVIFTTRSLFGTSIQSFEVSAEQSVNIDAPADLERARHLLLLARADVSNPTK